MLRTLFWFIVWLCTLGAATIDVKYRDGLRVKIKGWAQYKDKD